MVFLGSSHTLNSVDDKLISRKLNGMQVINFGYCRYGRNLTYALLEEILSTKKVRYAVIEVRENEDHYSHPVFPFIADSRDVIFARPFFNKKMFSDIWNHLAYKIEITQDRMYLQENIVPFRKSDFGYSPVMDTLSSALLNEIIEKRQGPMQKVSELEMNFNNTFARGYIRKIARLCHKNKITMYFLYLPSCRSTFSAPSDLELYKRYGNVLIPPDSILSETNYWFDEGHLNSAGGAALSKWLADIMKEDIQ